VDTENRTNGYTSVQVGGTVNGITCYGVTSMLVFGKEDCFLLLLRNQNSTLSGRAHGCDEEIVANDIKFLLVVTCCVA
jgi:hypothetical protein